VGLCEKKENRNGMTFRENTQGSQENSTKQEDGEMKGGREGMERQRLRNDKWYVVNHGSVVWSNDCTDSNQQCNSFVTKYKLTHRRFCITEVKYNRETSFETMVMRARVRERVLNLERK
jgi:hypothetical protein